MSIKEGKGREYKGSLALIFARCSGLPPTGAALHSLRSATPLTTGDAPTTATTASMRLR